MKKKLISLLLVLVMVLCLVPTAMAEESLPFTATVGETSLTAVSKTENAYTYHGWTGDETVDVYTVTIPDAATAVTLTFDVARLVYNYKADGNYLDGTYDADYSEHTGALYEGETQREVAVDFNNDGVLDYIQVQTPYHEPYNSDNYFSGETDVLYAITFRYANAGPGPATGTTIGASVQNAYSMTRSLLSGRKVNYTWAGGTSNSDDWDVFGLARDGVSIPQSYIISAKAFTPASDTSITDCARAILTLTACGETAGDALLAGVTNKDNMTQSNAVIFALLALDSKEYTVPAGGMSRDELVTLLLSLQQGDNAWGYSYASGTDWTTPRGTDVDNTAQAITALAPYYTTNINVKNAVDKALLWLGTRQTAAGTFGYSETYSDPVVESTSQVIVALTALGIDPTTWNSKDAVSAMCTMALPTGGFTYGGSFNKTSTAQGYYALVAYYRFYQGKNALYNMTDAMPQTYPHYHPVPAASTVTSVKTADTGILLYAALSASALLGMGYVGKKRH